MTQVLVDIPLQFWAVLGEMAPFLLFGFLAAGALSVLVSPRFVERHLGGDGIGPVLKAAAFGVPLPLCSCGVIPVAASLRRHGASPGATTAFLIATPQDGVDSVLVTFSLLGWVFAIFRVGVALVSGVIGGIWVAAGQAKQHAGPAPTPCHDACRAGRDRGRLRRALAYGFVTLPRDIGRPLLGGLVVAALISAAVPKDSFAPYLGGGAGAILIMMLLGVPVYVCATASVPVAAALVMTAGVSPGAALAFLMTGPATNAATIVTVWRVLGRRTALIYLATVAGSAVAAGLLLDALVATEDLTVSAGMPWMLPAAGKSVGAVVLLAILGWAVFGRRSARPPQAPATGQVQSQELRVGGMTCSHCAANVRRALLACAGVTAAEVDLGGGAATVTGERVDPEALRSAVEGLGYRATIVSEGSARPGDRAN